MFTALMALLGSSPVGAIIGGLFAFLNKKNDLEVRRLEFEQESKRWQFELDSKEKDIALVKMEAESRKDVAIVEGDARIEQARAEAIASINESERIDAATLTAAGSNIARYIIITTNTLSKVVRPVITLLFMASVVSINTLVVSKLMEVWPEMDEARQMEISMYVLAWFLGQASAIIQYWFVSRGSSGNK